MTVNTAKTDSLAALVVKEVYKILVNLSCEDHLSNFHGFFVGNTQTIYKLSLFANLGNPVAFGEATERAPILIVKTTHNSSGSCRIDYRILTEDGEVLQVANSGGKWLTTQTTGQVTLDVLICTSSVVSEQVALLAQYHSGLHYNI